MQSQAQIDQLLRQKSDAREIPGVVAVAASGTVSAASELLAEDWVGPLIGSRLLNVDRKSVV